MFFIISAKNFMVEMALIWIFKWKWERKTGAFQPQGERREVSKGEKCLVCGGEEFLYWGSTVRLFGYVWWSRVLDSNKRELAYMYYYMGFPGGARGKEPTCQCRRHKKCGFDPWTGKIPWRKAQEPTPVFLPGESHGQRSLMDYGPRVAKSQPRLKQFSTQHSLSI